MRASCPHELALADWTPTRLDAHPTNDRWIEAEVYQFPLNFGGAGLNGSLVQCR
ncbi:MAG TPA: hypothetical protein V6C57_18970 [Coleofasciculaceae cyanobacterium]